MMTKLIIIKLLITLLLLPSLCFAEAKSMGKVEIIALRTLNTKIYDLGNGIRRAEMTTGHQHYKDKTDKQLKQIDLTLSPTLTGWEMRKASYEVELPEYADGQIKFINSFIFNPDNLQSSNMVEHNLPEEEVIFKAIGVSHVKGVLSKKEIVYKDAFGKDIDLILGVSDVQLNKLVRINKKPGNLTQDLQFKFEINVGKGYRFNTEHGIWDKVSSLQTRKKIILGDKKKTWIQDYAAWDSNDFTIDIKVKLEKIAGKTYLTKIIPKEFLGNKLIEYPVYTDTTTTFYAGSGDGRVQGDTTAGEDYCDPEDVYWNYVHNSAIGTNRNTGAVVVKVQAYMACVGYPTFVDWFTIRRGFFPLDTSALGSSVNIQSADFVLYINDERVDPYFGLVETTQAAVNSLVKADYDQCGSTHSPAEGATRVQVDTTPGPETFVLNGTGLPWIKRSGEASTCGTGGTTGWTCLGVREADHDLDDVMPVDDTYHYAYFYSSEEATTASDPRLVVTYTEARRIMLIH